NPPIWVRDYDWVAHLEDSDGAPDASWRPMGCGPTRRNANRSGGRDRGPHLRGERVMELYFTDKVPTHWFVHDVTRRQWFSVPALADGWQRRRLLTAKPLHPLERVIFNEAFRLKLIGAA